MPYKSNNNRGGRPKSTRADYMSSPAYTDKFPSGPSREGEVDSAISIKAMRGLPNSSYAVKADPYQASLPTSSPYQFLAPFLRTVGGHYAGLDNIDGGNVQQYANSTKSRFLHYFDSLRLRLKLNYRYLPNTNDIKKGKGLVDEMRKSIAEAVSVLQSTTFTSLAINNFAVETDMNMGSAVPTYFDAGWNKVTTKAEAKHTVYTNITDVLYAMSIYYQEFLQEALSVMNMHNSFRLKQGTAIRDAWGREVPSLNSFFGLMNKKAFLSLLDSINLSFEGEYIDKDFMTQVNYLTFMPSRRSNAFTDPVLEIDATMSHPKIFNVYISGDDGAPIDKEDPYFYEDGKLGGSVKREDGMVEFYSFWTCAREIKSYLSLEATKRWARRAYRSNSFTTDPDNGRYNYIKALFDGIIASFIYFKPQWADFRTCIDIMTRTGTINWSKGFRPSITRDTDAPLFRNMIVEDIYKLALSGAHKLNYNPNTKRWDTFSQWGMYSGTPEYDTKQGGAFITFSTKILDIEDDDEQVPYLPVMFELDPVDGVYCVGISREGHVANIGMATTIMADDKILSRLVPIYSQNKLEIRLPYISKKNNPVYNPETNPDAGLDDVDRSTLIKTLDQIFGLSMVDISTGDQSLSEWETHVSVDSDFITVYQVEIEDITNMAITYARANAPFRGTTSEQGLLGFFGITKA